MNHKTKTYIQNKSNHEYSKIGSSIIGVLFAVLLVLPSSVKADTDRFFNLGLEGGLAVPEGASDFGGHISIRTSLVKIRWLGGRDKLTPKSWQGGYARAEWNPQGSRAVLGYGHSLFKQTGLEYGLLLADGQNSNFGYGGEVSLYTTTGLAAIYIRENVVMDGDWQWQTNIGIRVQFPINVD